MQRNISALVNGVQTATGAVHAAASEIAAGHHDLGRRTESQAASLEETAAGLAALTSTVGHTAAKVTEASGLAAEARTIAVRSGTVVHDVVREGGHITEDTFDWYAQDTTGTVWYMGEDTKELENGHVVSTEGSWEAGVDGAKPGILIPGTPVVGQVYRQEYYACVAEDKGEVLALSTLMDVEPWPEPRPSNHLGTVSEHPTAHLHRVDGTER